MGYDLHITRALIDYESEWFPILAGEVEALVAAEPDLAIPPDAPRRPDFCFVLWTGSAPDREHYLLFQYGRLSIKNPEPPFVRRMVELAAHLDAWPIGDNGELYSCDGDRLRSGERDWSAIARDRHFLRRPTPITPGEWASVTATQPDFTPMTRIKTPLPSGVRTIACPEVSCWTAHPSGDPIPFYVDDGAIQVRHADAPTRLRMTALAPALAATTVDDHDRPF
ncbi:hypothetical protein [Actinoplanes sp. NPDC051851]|uniref:hypothetical protein n=1 Tax=Actinoplanes sp. NPDC051851 TaxID=3154753 RepID=UPI00342D5EFB